MNCIATTRISAFAVALTLISIQPAIAANASASSSMNNIAISFVDLNGQSIDSLILAGGSTAISGGITGTAFQFSQNSSLAYQYLSQTSTFGTITAGSQTTPTSLQSSVTDLGQPNASRQSYAFSSMNILVFLAPHERVIFSADLLVSGNANLNTGDTKATASSQANLGICLAASCFPILQFGQLAGSAGPAPAYSNRFDGKSISFSNNSDTGVNLSLGASSATLLETATAPVPEAAASWMLICGFALFAALGKFKRL